MLDKQGRTTTQKVFAAFTLLHICITPQCFEQHFTYLKLQLVSVGFTFQEKVHKASFQMLIAPTHAYIQGPVCNI